jgi:hypothetical protein
MSEITITDKISETITNAFKKSKIFEKIEKFEMYFGSFLLITSIVGITTISINMLARQDIINIKENIEGNENVLKYHIDVNRKRNLIEHCSLKSEILMLNNQLLLLLENQEKIISLLEDIKIIKNSDEHRLSINISKIDCISASTSMNTFSPIKIPLLLDTNNIADDVKDQEYDELLNECYDAIPLNNLKKTTGLSWLFN